MRGRGGREILIKDEIAAVASPFAEATGDKSLAKTIIDFSRFGSK